MKHARAFFYLFSLFFAIALLFGSSSGFCASENLEITESVAARAAHLPPLWLALPFVILLVMIATGPLFYHRFWERHYPKLSLGFGLVVAAYYAFLMEQGTSLLVRTLEEYLSFIALISSLFVVSGGILIRINRRGTPLTNSLLLLFGAAISNIIGTTGASMLLIRPFMRMNEGRLKAFHIVFFIFMVSNIGGALTPVGDPPLFLGFLKGVPFFWVFQKLWLPWLLTLCALLLLFLVLDARSGSGELKEVEANGGVSVRGKRNFFYLALIIGAVFLDPAVIQGFPSLQERFHLPFGIRELMMFGAAFAAYKTANHDALKGNAFNFEPLREVAFLFIGIFATMIPALALIAFYAETHAAEFSLSRFYWMTGVLSGVLDNAPTYMNFLAAASGKFGLAITSPAAVKAFAGGIASPVPGDSSSALYLMAISIASVFFGAMSYIGNAPNFMVKNIASQAGADVPDFLQYIWKYSLPILLPLFILLWLLFFNY